MIDPIDARSHHQGVPQFKAQYIKLNTPDSIVIFITFTYMSSTQNMFHNTSFATIYVKIIKIAMEAGVVSFMYCA